MGIFNKDKSSWDKELDIAQRKLRLCRVMESFKTNEDKVINVDSVTLSIQGKELSKQLD